MALMAIFIRPFKASDLSAFVPIEPMGKDELKEMAKAIEDSNLAVTGIKKGKIVGCGGVHPLNNGQGELWLRLSKNCQKYKFDTLHWLRDGLKIIEEIYPFQQLNASIKANFRQSIKLIEFLGFKKTQIIDGKWLIYSKRVQECQD